MLEIGENVINSFFVRVGEDVEFATRRLETVETAGCEAGIDHCGGHCIVFIVGGGSR